MSGEEISWLLEAPAATATGSAPLNMTEVVRQQAKDQRDVDGAIPLNLILGFTAVLVLCLALAHPRFLARAFASQRSKTQGEPVDYVFKAASAQGGSDVGRVAGGGDLSKGWWLSCRAEGSAVADRLHLDQRARSSAPAFHPPPHVSPAQSHLPFSSTLLYTPFARLPLRSSATLSQLYLLAGMTALILIALWWQCDLSPTTDTKGYGSNFARSGMVALAQIPVVVALGVRGNFPGLCLGLGYERLKLVHKFVGRSVFLCTTLHVVLFLRKWALGGDFAALIARPQAIAGMIGVGSLLLLTVTSIAPLRQASYHIFKACHVIGILGLHLGLAFHVNIAVPFVIASMAIYLMSIISSFAKTHVAEAELLAVPDSATTVVTIPKYRSGWRAGQHLRIRVPCLGGIHRFESHPFTIASDGTSGGIVLMVKSAGDWTSRLLEYASTPENLEGAQAVRTASVIIEGPYGGLGNTLPCAFSSIVVISAGSGISHALSLVNNLLHRSPTGAVRARTIDFVWVVRSETAARAFMPTLQELYSEAQTREQACLEAQNAGVAHHRPLALRIKVNISRADPDVAVNLLTANPFEDHPIESPQSGATQGKLGFPFGTEKRAGLHRNDTTRTTRSRVLSSIDAAPGRPDLERRVSSLVEETAARYEKLGAEASGVLVTACGPLGLVDDARRAVRKIDGRVKRAAGGVEFESEYFGF